MDEVAPQHLSEANARALTDRITETLEVAYDLLEQAWLGGAWYVLGYASWDAYCAAEFSHARMISPAREQRQAICAHMSETGMSQRDIASAVGVSQMTVQRDLSKSTSESDDLEDDLGEPVSEPTGRRCVPVEDEVVEAEIVDDDSSPRQKRTDVVGTMSTIMRKTEELAKLANSIQPQHLKSRKDEAEMWHRVLEPTIASLTALLVRLQKEKSDNGE